MLLCRIIVLALCICWSWSLNSDECEAKRAFDSQSHQFDRGGTYNNFGNSGEILLLPFKNTIFVGRDMGSGNDHGNDNIIISSLVDNTDSVDNTITDDNHMGGIDWYYYFQDGEVKIDSHDLGHSAIFIPDALASRTPKLWMPSTLLHIGNYDAMAILPAGYLPTVIPSYIHSCHYFVCPILLSTRDESQYYVHDCHRRRLMPNNGEWEWSNIINSYDYMAGYYARSSAGVPEDGLARISHQSPKRGDDLDARAMATITEEMHEQVTNGSDSGNNESPSAAVPYDGPDKHSNHSPTRGDVELNANASITVTDMTPPHSHPGEEWRTDAITWTQCLILRSSISPVIDTTHSISWGAIKSASIRLAYPMLTTTDNTSRAAGCFDMFHAVNIIWLGDDDMAPVDNLQATQGAPTANGLAYSSASFHPPSLYLLPDILPCYMHYCHNDRGGLSWTTSSMSLRLVGFKQQLSSFHAKLRNEHLDRMKHVDYYTFHITVTSDVSDLQPVERNQLKQDAVETAAFGTDGIMCGAPHELETARGYCYGESLNNGIGSPYQSSRDGKEYSVVISSGGYHWDASALMIKSSSTYYADTQVCMHAMHNSHPMHLVRSQSHGEPIGCILRRRRKNGELIDCIVKPRKHGERIVCTITPQHSLLHHGVAVPDITMLAIIKSIADTSSSVDDNFNSYVETIGIMDCVIGHFDVRIDNNITNGAGKSYANCFVDWGAAFEPLTNIYGHYCAAWKAQGKSSSLMSDTSVTSYVDICTSSSSPCTIIRRLLQLLLIWMQPFEMPLYEGNCRSIDSDTVYAWATSESGEDDLDVEVEEHDLTDDTNMPSCASLINGEQIPLEMIKEPDTNSIRGNDATIDRLLFGIHKHLMRQPMKRRFGGLVYMSMQQLMNLAPCCLSHEHHVIMVVFCIILHALIAPIIVPMNPYDASTTATKLELQAYGMRKYIAPPDGHNSTSSSTSIGGYDTVDDGIISSSTVVDEHPTSIEAERSYEGINLSGPRTRCVLTDDVFTGGLNIPTVDLHSCILSKIKNLRSYLGLLSSECMPQHLNELCRNDPTPSGRTHDATIVNFSSNIQPENGAHTNHLMLSYSFTLENISSGTLRFSAMVKYWAFQAISIWLILQSVLFLTRGKLKLTSTASNATTSNGHQTFGSLMGSRGLQYHIDRTNHGTNRRGVTNECRPHVDTDSISTIDASTALTEAF